jgi:hypothetical protein
MSTSGNFDHSIKVTLTTEMPGKHPWVHLYGVYGCLRRQDTSFTATSHTLTITGYGWITVEPTIAIDKFDPPCPVMLTVTVDGSIWGMWDDTLTYPPKYLGAPTGSWGLWDITVPNLCTLDRPFGYRITGGTFYHQYLNGEWITDCQDQPPGWWSPMTDMVRLSIIAGREYAWFQYGTEDGPQHESVSGLKYGTLYGTFLRIRRGIPDSANAFIVVRTEAGSIIREDTSYIAPQDSLFVTLDPPNLFPGDTANIIIKNRVDEVVSDFWESQLFEIGMVEGCSDGKLITTAGEGNYFRDVMQPFKFVADSTIDTTYAKIMIRVGPKPPGTADNVVPIENSPEQMPVLSRAMRKEKNNYRQQISIRPNLSIRDKNNPARPASDETCNADAFQYPLFGVGEAEIGKEKLKILDHSPWTIWPYLPAAGDSSRGADLPGYVPWRPFTIQVLDCDSKPLGGEEVTIVAEFIEGSGGHQHNTTSARRVLDIDKYGYFFGQGGKGQKTLDLTTRSDGKAIVDSFSQSQFSGQYLVKAYLKSDPSVFDTVNLKVQVPGLVRQSPCYITLPDTAATDLMCTFDQSDTIMYKIHASPYWMNPTAADSLLAAITEFYLWSRSPKGGGVPIRVSLNDASLEWGGAFEYQGTWNNRSLHCFHRVGCSIDINRKGIESEKKKENLFKLLNDYGGRKYPETQIHFGFNHQK